MNGRTLTLGLVGALALAGVVGRHGSFAKGGSTDLGQRLHTALRENEAFRILDRHPRLEGSDWGQGGCAVLARALHALVPGSELRAVLWRGEPSHYLVQHEGLLYDGDGASIPAAFWRRWNREYPTQSRATGAKIVPVGDIKDEEDAEILCPISVVRELVAYLRPRLFPTGSAARPARRTDPALWEAVKADVTASDTGGRPGQWSARKAQQAVQLYTTRGGGYLGPKDPNNALSRWTDQDWHTRSGGESLQTGERYLPDAAFSVLTPAQIGATTRAKRAGLARGQQFTPQPPSIARKTKKAREGGANTPFDADAFVEAFRHWYAEHDWEREPDEERAFRRWARAHGAPYLGAGTQRIVFSVPGGALKVAFDREGEQANRTETEVWEDAPEAIRRHLVPVLSGTVEGDAPWIVMEKVRVTGKGRMSEATRHALNACGIQDLTTQNLADDGRLLDYAWLYRDLWRGCTTGRGWANRGTPNVIAPSGYDQTARTRTGPSAPAQHLRAHAPQLLRGRVLDFGSGRGVDAKALGATPYDPHHPKGSVRRRPTGAFSTVLAVYVLNVLPKPERADALREAARFVRPGGHLVLAVRPEAEVAAATVGWTKKGDGHQLLGDDGTRTRFQRGYTSTQLTHEVRAVLGDRFTPVPLPALPGSVMGVWRRA